MPRMGSRRGSDGARAPANGGPERGTKAISVRARSSFDDKPLSSGQTQKEALVTCGATTP